MKLEIDKDTLPDFVIQILSGIDTAIKGLAGLSNNAGDRHANKFNTRKHHAKLAVNLAMTISDFLIESWNYQVDKKGSS
jgi:abortive infection Abi-like protein